MFCAISGKPPKFPVLSPSSKCIFEKELIEQYVKETGNDPVSNAPLNADQLIVISQTPQQFSLASAVNSSTLNSNYSIPNLLSTLQNEWDAIMLENFRLRKQLDAFTKQLSTALYERDAAKIVAANALKEREQVVKELHRLSLQIGVEEEPEPTTGLPQDMVQRLLEESKEYVETTRKTKDIFAIPERQLELKNSYDALGSPVAESVAQLQKGIAKKIVFAIDDSQRVCISQGSDITQVQLDIEGKLDFLTLTPDSQYILFSTAEGQVGTFHLKERQTRCIDCATHDIILMHSHEHILREYFLWVDKTGKVGYSSLDCSKTLVVAEGVDDDEFLLADLHKDGLLLALGQANCIKVYNLAKYQDSPTVWRVGEEIDAVAPITRLGFSSNGYWMLVSTSQTVMAFDLRKSVGTLAVAPLAINCQVWDMDLSGKSLAAWQMNKLQFYSFVKSSKKWEPREEPISLPQEELDRQELRSVNLSYDGSSTSLVLQTSDRILIYG